MPVNDFALTAFLQQLENENPSQKKLGTYLIAFGEGMLKSFAAALRGQSLAERVQKARINAILTHTGERQIVEHFQIFDILIEKITGAKGNFEEKARRLQDRIGAKNDN